MYLPYLSIFFVADIYQYYFCYCEAGFKTKTIGDVGITVGREGALELLEGIPFHRE